MKMKCQYNDGGRKAAGFNGSAKDCVVRSIAIATGQDYKAVHDAVNYLANEEHFDGSDSEHGVHKNLWRGYLESLGWTWVPTMGIGTGCKVHLAQGELPSGRLIVRVSRHLVAVIDGIILDTFDCSRDGTRCVYGYFKQNTIPFNPRPASVQLKSLSKVKPCQPFGGQGSFSREWKRLKQALCQTADDYFNQN